jgi:pyochelin biosynthesis protein PchC
MTGQQASWVRCFHPAPQAAVRLVCLPHAGGAAGAFRALSAMLQPQVEVLAVQYPGRQDRRAEPCVTEIRVLAELTHQALRPWLDRPFAVLGHSMGALLAFELVNALVGAAHRAPVALFASGRRAPSTRRVERAHLLPDDGLIEQVRRLNGTADSVLAETELIRAALPAVRADLQAVETYEYRPVAPLPCPIFAMVGDRDPTTTIEDARRWAAHTSADFELRVFPGGHFYLAEHQKMVGALIDTWLRRARSVGSTGSR